MSRTRTRLVGLFAGAVCGAVLYGLTAFGMGTFLPPTVGFPLLASAGAVGGAAGFRAAGPAVAATVPPAVYAAASAWGGSVRVSADAVAYALVAAVAATLACFAAEAAREDRPLGR